jgi:hypothetical protein
MEAKEYDRIADLLMQIRKKVKQIDAKTKLGQWTIDEYIKKLDILIINTDELGQADAKGWL